jgi:hypothetical protein
MQRKCCAGTSQARRAGLDRVGLGGGGGGCTVMGLKCGAERLNSFTQAVGSSQLPKTGAGEVDSLQPGGELQAPRLLEDTKIHCRGGCTESWYSQDGAIGVVMANCRVARISVRILRCLGEEKGEERGDGKVGGGRIRKGLTGDGCNF